MAGEKDAACADAAAYAASQGVELRQVVTQETLTPARQYSQQPASVETAMPARLSSPQRYRAQSEAQAPFSPTRGASLSTVSSMGSVSTVPMPPVAAPWPMQDSYPAVVAMTAPSTGAVVEHERVQVPRQFGRSPDMVLKDMGLEPRIVQQQTIGQFYGASSSPMLEQRNSVTTLPPVVETVVREPVPAQVTVVEKVVEQQGMSMQEMQVWLQGERSRLSSAMQEIVTQQSKSLTEVLNEEVHKVIHMVNAVSNSCEERLVRLEADRSARATAFQGLKRDVDGLQAQISDLEQFRVIGAKNEQAGKDREEVMMVLESVTNDIRNQHRSVLSGLAVQKEMQQRLGGALAEVRGDIETLASEVTNQKAALVGMTSQKDLLVLQKDQQTIDKAIVELRRQTQQSLEVIRSECATEVATLRQTHIGGLVERLSVLEGKRLDGEVQELTRLIHTERSGRNDLAQSVESYRASHLQTLADLRSEMDTWLEKFSRMEMAVVEERGARERSLFLEQSMNEIKNSSSRRFSDIESKLDGTGYVAKDVQELKKLIVIEQSERSDLAESFESHRKSQAQTFSQLREEIDTALQDLRRMSSSSATKCGELEKVEGELRNTMTKRFSELIARLDNMENSSMMSKEIEELTRLVRAENTARVDISQTLDAYRMAHLQTSTELRADLDVALEKLSRMESTSQARLDVAGGLGPSTPPALSSLTPQTAPRSSIGNSRLGLGGSVLSASRLGALGGLASTSVAATDAVAESGALLTPWSLSEDARATTTTMDAANTSSTSTGWFLRKGAAAGGSGGLFGESSTTEVVVEERLEVSALGGGGAVSGFSDLAAPLSSGLLPAAEDGIGSLLGRGLRSGASLTVASEVADVLADERRLIGRGLRAAGNR